MLHKFGGRSAGFAQFVRSGVLKKQGKECRQGEESLVFPAAASVGSGGSVPLVKN
jgi:hypothetical protein